jgi:hypothetical protein
MWKDYAVPGGTFRENLRREPGAKHAPSTHPAAKFRYDVLKEKYGDENGDIHIDRNAEKSWCRRLMGSVWMAHCIKEEPVNYQ